MDRIVRKPGIIVVTGRRGRGSMERISRRGRHDVVRERKEGDRDLGHNVLCGRYCQASDPRQDLFGCQEML